MRPAVSDRDRHFERLRRKQSGPNGPGTTGPDHHRYDTLSGVASPVDATPDTVAGTVRPLACMFRTSWADSLSASGDRDLIFEIHSVARSADRPFNALYSYLPVAREMQLHMWVHICCRVAEIAKGTVVGKPEVRTVRYEG